MPARPIRPEDQATIEYTLRAGKRSQYKRTVTLAEKIAVMIVDLRGRLADEREHFEQQRKAEEEREAARRRVAELEQQLAAEKAKLQPKRKPRNGKKEPCPHGCGSFLNLGVHKAHKHPEAKTPKAA